MGRDSREVENTLLNKFSFTRATTHGKDHRWLHLALPGLPLIATKFSHTREDIGNTLWQKIASQLRVRPNYLGGMIDCTNSRQAYYSQVRTNPDPPWNHLMRGNATTSEQQPQTRAAKRRAKHKKK